MNGSQAALSAMAVGTYVIIGGFFAQSGVLLNAAASSFHAPVPQTAAMFSSLAGGALVALIVCMFAFNLFAIRSILIGAYVVLLGGVVLLASTHSMPIASLAIGLCGFGAGVGLSTGAVIIAKTLTGRPRVLGFLGTDCTFSLAGFIFPPIAANAIAAGWAWQSGYVAVGVVAVLLIVGAAVVRFPPTGAKTTVLTPNVASATPLRSYIVVGMFALALCTYLCGQGAFLIWAPNDLAATFALPALAAATIIGSFWGPSIFGLLTAAVLVIRVPARWLLVGASGVAVGILIFINATHDLQAFFTETLAFGFTSTCLFKLMISIGSEQIAGAPPVLVTFLLLSGTIGSTVAPAISAYIVNQYGVHAGLFMALVCYALTFVAIVIALAIERGGTRALVRGTELSYGAA